MRLLHYLQSTITTKNLENRILLTSLTVFGLEDFSGLSDISSLFRPVETVTLDRNKMKWYYSPVKASCERLIISYLLFNFIIHHRTVILFLVQLFKSLRQILKVEIIPWWRRGYGSAASARGFVVISKV